MRRLLYIALAVALTSCTQKQEEPASSSSPKSPSPPVVMTPASAPRPVDVPPVFANLGDCEKSGATLPSCARAQNVARVMAQLDAPKFASKEKCEQVFQNCIQNPSSQTPNASPANKFSPQLTSFGLGGNATTAPTAQAPAQITPVYTTQSGVLAMVFASSATEFTVVPVKDNAPAYVFKP